MVLKLPKRIVLSCLLHKALFTIKVFLKPLNGRVERKHRHLLETARAIRFHAGLPIKFWGDCLLAATHLINMLPSSVLKWKSPFEMLMHKVPDYSYLRVIGCLCYAYSKSSVGSRASKCILVGYPFAQKGYKLYDLTTHKLVDMSSLMNMFFLSRINLLFPLMVHLLLIFL